MEGGKIRVTVRSRKVPSRTVDFTEPVYSTSGVLMGTRSNRLIIYDDVLDEAQRKAIEEGRKLSCTLGLDLEVIDRSNASLFSRVLSRLSRDGSTHISVDVTPSRGVRTSTPQLLANSA